MSDFRPFRATLYSDPAGESNASAKVNGAKVNGVMVLDDVIAPYCAAYDEQVRTKARQRSAFNVAHLLGFESPLQTISQTDWQTDSSQRDCPEVDSIGLLVRKWLDTGVLREETTSALYSYRLGYRDSDDLPHQVSGVIGMFRTWEDRIAEDRDHDRMPCVSLPILRIDAPGFSDLLVPSGIPLARATDDQGAHHRLWRLDQPGVCELISSAVHKAHDEERLQQALFDIETKSDVLVPPKAGTPKGTLAFVTEDIPMGVRPALGVILGGLRD